MSKASQDFCGRLINKDLGIAIIDLLELLETSGRVADALDRHGAVREAMKQSPRRVPRRAPLARLAANKASCACLRCFGQPLRTAPASSEVAGKFDEDGAAKDGQSLASTSIGFNTSLYRALRTPGPLMEWAAVQELEVLEAKKQHLAELEDQRQQLLKAKEERRQLRQRWREEAEADAQRFHAEEAAKKQRVFEVRRQFDEDWALVEARFA
eukprot:s434_g12.t1